MEADGILNKFWSSHRTKNAFPPWPTRPLKVSLLDLWQLPPLPPITPSESCCNQVAEGFKFPLGVKIQSDLGQLGKEQVSSFVQLGSLSPQGPPVGPSFHSEVSDLTWLSSQRSPQEH